MGQRKNHCIKAALLSMASCLVLANLSPAQAQQPAANQEITINLPAGPLPDRLIDLGDALSVNIFAADRLVAGKTAPAISGSLTPERAITALLNGSDLSVRQTGPAAFEIAQAETGSRIDTLATSDVPSLGEQPITETLVVTGSRIERTAVNSPAPIDIVTANDIAKLGLTDTTEALRFTPALNSSVSISTQGQLGFGTGQLFGLATLDLRGLGTNRTLVLVNGRRHVSGVANSATVDVSSIPAALIQRVEVLTGGGSSIYGADAVSGVVNYVLKDDFEGVDIRGNASLPTRGGGEAYFGAVTMGGNFSGGRGNAVVSLEYNRQTSLLARDRSGSTTTSFIRRNTPELAATLGVDRNFINVLVPDARDASRYLQPNLSLEGSTVFNPLPVVGSEASQIGGLPSQQIFDPAIGAFRSLEPVPFISAFLTQGGDGANFAYSNPKATTIPDSERIVFNANANYDFTNQISGFVEVKYSRNESLGRGAQPSLFYDIPIQSDNPFIPSQIQAQLNNLVAQGITPSLVVSRGFVDDAAEQPFVNTRETVRIVGGLKGEISEALAYEISANYGRTDTSFVDPSEPLLDRVYAAFDAIADPVTGEPICRSDVDQSTFPGRGFFPGVAGEGFRAFVPGQGCVPQSIFAATNELDPDFIAFAFQRTEVEFETEQFVINGVFSGNSETFFKLPAGGVGYAAGFEYRDERGENRPDPLQIANLGERQLQGSPSAIGGDFDVLEGFAEINIPILADLPFAKSLSLDASVRVADYSTIGTATSFAFGTVWQPTDDLRIRASFNRAVRAPNISELFTPQDSFAAAIAADSDPCVPANINSGSATRQQNCAQFIPDLANFDASASAVPGAVTELRGGNPNLNEEVADTFTVGVVYAPTSVPGLTVIADYFSIQIDDAISFPPSRLVLIENCVDAASTNNPFCESITRNTTTGVIETLNRTTFNFAESRAKGIDYQVGYRFNLDNVFEANLGDFDAQIAGTYLIEREDRAFAGFPESDNRLDGELDFPKHFLNVSLAWNKGPWSADYGFNFQSSQTVGGLFGSFGIEDIEENPLLLDRPKTGNAFVHFLGGSYTFNETIQLSVRVNNLFDRDPFELANRNTVRPVSFLGRTVQLGVQAKF